MSKNSLASSSRFALPFALAMGLLAAAVPETRAGGVYAYSQQTLSNLVFSGATLNVPIVTSTQASATLNGSGPSTSDDTDALQAFIGDSAYNTGQNKFVANGALGANPFARGDTLWSGSGGSTVAEGSLNTAGIATAVGQYTLSTGFTLTTGGNVHLDLDYTNALHVAFSAAGSGLAAANFNSVFTLVLKNTSTGEEFAFSPNELNQNLSMTSAGVSKSLGDSDHIVITATALSAGVYTASIEAGSTINLRQTAIPEPSSVILMGCGVLAAAGFAGRRARRKTVEA